MSAGTQAIFEHDYEAYDTYAVTSEDGAPSVVGSLRGFFTRSRDRGASPRTAMRFSAGRGGEGYRGPTPSRSVSRAKKRKGVGPGEWRGVAWSGMG